MADNNPALLNPTPEEVNDKVGPLRTAFKSTFAEEIAAGEYDARDLARLDKDDAYTRCFLRTMESKGDVDKAAGVVDTAFKFRKEMGIWDYSDASVPPEIRERNAMYYKGQDKHGHPLLYINVKENTASGKEQMDALKQYIAFKFEEHHRVNCEQMCVVIFDMSGAGISNLNKEITKYIIACFSNYFPAYLAYMINYEMPMLLSGVWKVISAFISTDRSRKIIMVKKKNIANYLPADSLWPHMK